jgi:hypothetical protein
MADNPNDPQYNITGKSSDELNAIKTLIEAKIKELKPLYLAGDPRATNYNNFRKKQQEIEEELAKQTGFADLTKLPPKQLIDLYKSKAAQIILNPQIIAKSNSGMDQNDIDTHNQSIERQIRDITRELGGNGANLPTPAEVQQEIKGAKPKRAPTAADAVFKSVVSGAWGGGKKSHRRRKSKKSKKTRRSRRRRLPNYKF